MIYVKAKAIVVTLNDEYGNTHEWIVADPLEYSTGASTFNVRSNGALAVFPLSSVLHIEIKE